MSVQLKVKSSLRAGMENPASANCVNMGGKLDIVKIPSCGGEVGICSLPQGQVCEEWELFRGDCGPMLTLGMGR